LSDAALTNYLRALYYLTALARHDYWPRKKLAEYQNKRLRHIVKYAFDHVPFYHVRIKEAGMRPEDVKTTEDLNKLPLITKGEIKKNLHLVISDEFDVRKLRSCRTSGSTGEPLFFYVSESEDEYRKAKHLRANIRCGQQPLDQWITIVSPIYFGQTSRLQRLFGVYVPRPISVFTETSEQLSMLGQIKPDILDGYSNSLLALAKEMRKKDIETVRPRFLLSGAELIDASSVRLIENAFSAPLYDQYGSAEFERLASQCTEKSGYHVDADSVVMQFVDKDGEEVAPGERGEVVCTSLFNYAMPFVRYVVGDVGALSTETDCPCGRKLPMIKVIEGRKNSLLVLPDGRTLVPFSIIAAIMTFKSYDQIEKFRLVQSKRDLLRLQVKKKEDVSVQNDLGKELADHMKSMLQLDPNITGLFVEFVDDIPLSKGGKLAIVVSEVEEVD
jgi:phenylacetate-CoA ligase